MSQRSPTSVNVAAFGEDAATLLTDDEFEDVDETVRGLTLKTLHVTMLGVATLVLLLAALLEVRADQLVEFRFAPGHPLPEVCTMKKSLHVDCPGCGLTRSFVYLMRGDITASLRVHPLGWLAFLLTVAQFPYRLWAMRSPHRAPFGHFIPWIPLIAIIILIWYRWILHVLV